VSAYIIGIDLGTTNSAIGFVDTRLTNPTVQAFAVEQTVAPGLREPRPTLPSVLYLAGEGEFAADAFALSWPSPPRRAVGEFARVHGPKVPIRLVSSAKSWLCHAGVDRTAPLLPWQAPDEVGKVSPVEASAAYLGQLRGAWDTAHPDAPMAQQDIFLTVPASFDAVARDLTVRAAAQAGLPQVTLLEEPQAAFYSWLAAQGEGWRKQLEVGDVVLVCDVGGGTTDFSLIAVTDDGGHLALERIAVGDHILLGGDNMDLALAYAARARLQATGVQLDNWQLASLTLACRAAKEDLVEHPDKASATVTIPGRGSKLIGGSLQGEVLRDDLGILLDGFFPLVGPEARPAKERRGGLRELGLPFAADAAVTKHLAAFLGAQGRRPTCVLFNGGVMKGRVLRQRVLETLDSWSDSPDDDLKALGGTDLDLAVAHGAAYYGLVRRGRGVRIRGGTARSYYIGIESAQLAVPGMTPPMKALCVAPFGMEEGTETALPGRELGLIVGEPVEFRFLSSTTRRDDKPGVLLDDAAELTELAPVSTSLAAEEGAAGSEVPVTLRARVTEVGTLELWCDERGGGRHWKLEYNVRDAG